MIAESVMDLSEFVFGVHQELYLYYGMLLVEGLSKAALVFNYIIDKASKTETLDL